MSLLSDLITVHKVSYSYVKPVGTGMAARLHAEFINGDERDKGDGVSEEFRIKNYELGGESHRGGNSVSSGSELLSCSGTQSCSKARDHVSAGSESCSTFKFALNGVNLAVAKGEIHGLIGPDSAGKTTLMRLLCGLLPMQAGEAGVFNKDVITEYGKIRARIGYMPQRFSLYQDLSVEENLLFFARLFGVSSADRKKLLPELYGFSRLEKFKTRRAGALSGGMKQKLALTCALIHRPELLILDEPTYGVDPVSRQEFWQMLKSIQKDGTTILVSTPYMDEAELCDRITLLFNGKVLAFDTPAAIKAAFSKAVYVVQSAKIREMAKLLDSFPELDSCQLFGNELHLIMDKSKAEQVFAHRALAKLDRGFAYHQTQPNMEDIFLSYMNYDRNH